MRRCGAPLVLAGLLVGLMAAGCGAGDGTSATKASPPATTGEALAPTTSTTAPAPATTVATTTPASDLPPAVLLVNQEGVHLLPPDRDPELLVRGPVASAVDDTRGGLLFQVAAGRTWPAGAHGMASTVWWIPVGQSEALDLLVTARPSELTLHDAVTLGGDVAVVYTRSDGGFIDDAVDRLRRFSLEHRDVTEVLVHGAWEQGYEGVSAGSGLLAFTEFGQVDSWCSVVDLAGAAVTVAGIPEATGCEHPACPENCALSADGSRLAWTVGQQVFVVDTGTGQEIMRYALDPSDGAPVGLDLSGEFVLVNRQPEHGWGTALVVVPGPDGPASRELVMPGIGRFVSGSVEIEAPAAHPVIGAIRLRADGLGIVDFGDPVDGVLAVMTSRLGEPTSGQLVTGPWPADDPHACTGATGYGCIAYFRAEFWDLPPIGLIFTDAAFSGEEGEPHLAGWVVSLLPHAAGPTTEAGIGPGSTVADLITAYGDKATIPSEPEECAGSWQFGIELPSGGSLRGALTAAPWERGSVVSSMEAGQGSSC